MIALLLSDIQYNDLLGLSAAYILKSTATPILKVGQTGREAKLFLVLR